MGVAELSYRDAVIRGIAQEMDRDNRVVFLGEDIGKAGAELAQQLGQPLRGDRRQDHRW